MSFKKISVIGLGYIGLPTAAMFASKNQKVIGVDVDSNIVDTINRGDIHIVEPGLEDMVRSAVKSNLLVASTVTEKADAFLIAVPTPFKQSNDYYPTPDLTYVKSAIDSISGVLKSGDIIILESTSPIGTTEKISQWLSKARPDLIFPNLNDDNCDVNIAYCPERVLPGNIIDELVQNDRIIGGLTESCSNKALSLYKLFVEGECIQTNSRTAEMAKLTENSSRDVQIAFANELSMICDKSGIDVWELISLTNRHPRVNILQPGPGVGGHCIAVDPWFIVNENPKDSKLIKMAREVNDAKPKWVIEKTKEKIKLFKESNKDNNLDNVIVACYGLSFKANIDDLRESPALQITKQINKLKLGKVIAVEPNISNLDCADIDLVSMDYALANANIHLVLVDHEQFKLKVNLDKNFIIDTKGIW
jgi:UDP-N-acetyl-D-mannosaminuronic acid dehydrogenase